MATRTYLRYELEETFGVVASPNCNILFDQTGQLAVTPTLENVSVWNVKTGELLHILCGEKSEVTCIAAAPDGLHLAVGYHDGSIRVWEMRINAQNPPLEFHGHKSAVNSLRYSNDGSLLASGSNDTDIIIWDPVAECGLFRLKGHKDQITDLAFLDPLSSPSSHSSASSSPSSSLSRPSGPSTRLLVSSSKDGLVKIWDLELQHCMQTLVGHRSEVWSMDINVEQTLLVTGSSDKRLRIWKLDYTANSSFSSSLSSSPSSSSSSTTTTEVATFWGYLERNSNKRVSSVRFDPRYQSPSTQQDLSSNEGKSSSKSSKKLRGSLTNNPCLLACQGADKVLDFYRLRPPTEVEKKIKRRLKRQREKAKKKGEELIAEENREVTVADVFEPLLPLRTAKKITSFAWLPPTPSQAQLTSNKLAYSKTLGLNGDESSTSSSSTIVSSSSSSSPSLALVSLPGAGIARVLVALSSNRLIEYDINLASGVIGKGNSSELKNVSNEAIYELSLPGHRGGVRSSMLSGDNTLLMTTSNDQLKIWNVSSTNCIRTLSTGYGLCGIFVPGDGHVVLGTKTGELELWEIASGTLLTKVKAHEGEVWTLDPRPDGKGFASGGADKEVKFWEYETILTTVQPKKKKKKKQKKKSDDSDRSSRSDSGSESDSSSDEDDDMEDDAVTTSQLTMVHVRTLKVTDDVLCIRHSPDGRLVAIGLLDCTVKVFYHDTLKFFLSLYGHKLPVLCLDISSDSTLLVTGSADKNIKLWGLDFGDCHKSIFAHADSVMAVRFVENTHLFFTASKDKMIKYWDGDKFEHVINLEGHQAEVWSLAVASTGMFLVSTSNDRSIRVWNQTDEPVFLEEEREKELEEMYDEGVGSLTKGQIGEREGGLERKESESGAVAGDKVSKDSLKAGERLLEALELVKAEEERKLEFENVKAARKLKQKEKKKKKKAEPVSGLQAALLEMQGKTVDDMDHADDDEADPDEMKYPANPLLQGKNTVAYIYTVMMRIRPAELEEALMVLPFEYARLLIKYLDKFIELNWVPEKAVKSALLLTKTHQNQIISNHIMVDELSSIRANTRKRLRAQKKRIGFNMAALQFLQRDIKQNSSKYFFGEDDRDKNTNSQKNNSDSNNSSRSNSLKRSANGGIPGIQAKRPRFNL